jgi:pimeloyl-ACP methyl ester carboxylesterase
MKGPQPARVEIEGAELAVRLAGDRDKPALLLMHGLPNSSTYFRNVIGPLSRDCFVIARTCRGSEARSRSVSLHSRDSRT